MLNEANRSEVRKRLLRWISAVLEHGHALRHDSSDIEYFGALVNDYVWLLLCGTSDYLNEGTSL
ncbi:MAG: hypothetical protein JWO13_3593 [Acidobacteriales bacterium]|nr:hypothetical protein [Terriglobales bacterium]